jgi:hypothetical protein
MSKESKPSRIIIEKHELKPIAEKSSLRSEKKLSKESDIIDLKYADKVLSRNWTEVCLLYELVYTMNSSNASIKNKKNTVKNCLEDFRGTKDFDILYKTASIFDQMAQEFPEEIEKSYREGVYPSKKFILESLERIEKPKKILPIAYTDKDSSTPASITKPKKSAKKRVRFNEEVEVAHTEILLDKRGKRYTGEIITEKLQDEISIKDAIFNGSFKATKLNPLKEILSKPTKRDFDVIEESKSENSPKPSSPKALKTSPKKDSGIGI